MKSIKNISKIFEADSPIKAVYPLIVINRFIGVAPFKHIIKVNASITTFHYPSLIWSFFIYAMYTYSIITVSLNGESISKMFHYPYFYYIADSVRMLLAYILSGILGLSGLINMKNYAKSLEYLEDVGSMFKILQVKNEYTKIRASYVIFMCSHLTLHGLFMSFSIYYVQLANHQPSVYLIICMYLPGILAVFTYSIFNSLNLLVYNSFSTLNKEIKKINEHNSNIFAFDKRFDSIKTLTSKLNVDALLERIEMLWKIYDKICDTCDCINDIFSLKILIILTSSFIAFVLNEYQVLITLFYIQKSLKCLPVLFFSIQQVFLYLFMNIFMITTCDKCKSAAKYTSTLINEIMISETEESITRKLHRFSTYMLHRRPNYNGSGLFQIDNTLMFTMVGASTTYIVILIQFSLNTSMDNDNCLSQ